MLDLGLVVADKNMEFTVRGIFARPQALGIRKIDYRIVVHPWHDGGVRTDGPETLATLQGQVSHGIVMLDFEGSGADGDALSVEAELDDRLQMIWGDRAKAIVIGKLPKDHIKNQPGALPALQNHFATMVPMTLSPACTGSFRR